MMPNPTPAILESANRFRAQLLARERRAASGMARYYGRIWGQLQGDIRYVQSEVERKRAADQAISEGQIWRLKRLKAIQAQADRELARFAEFADDTITAGQRESLVAGERNARDLMLAAFPADAGVDVSFAAMPREAVESLVGFLADGSPLRKLLVEAVDDAAQGFADMMVTGLAAGWNPRKLARALRSEFGMGLTRALRIARTEQLRAYRTASLRAYQGSDTVVGWERMAAQDDRTCMACVMLDGKRYGVDEPMDDHPQGRCLPPGQFVFTDQGWRRIEDVAIGDQVLTHLCRYRTVTGVQRRLYSGDIVELESRFYLLHVTPSHPILTQRGWVNANEVRASDTLRTLNDVLVLESSRSTVQPSSPKRWSFLASASRLLGEWCQGGSSSTANIWRGKAKSMLNLSTAISGTGENQAPRKANRKENSAGLCRSAQCSWRLRASLHCVLSVWAAACMSIKKAGFAIICRKTASLGDIGRIPQNLISFISDRVLMPTSAVNCRYVASSSMYLLPSQSHTASPSFCSSSLRHLNDAIRPRSRGDFFSPKTLARWWTAFVVRPGNRSAIAVASFIQNVVRTISSSWAVQRLPAILSSFQDIGNSIHHPLTIGKSDYEGLVYNLQVEEDESYIAGGLVVHNCAMLPITKSYAEMGIDAPEPDFSREKGEDWFRAQPPEVQERMMGKGMFAAWKDGQFQLADIPKLRESSVWGGSWVPKGLGELGAE